MSFLAYIRWSLALGIAALVTVVPFVYYRWEYTYAKRLREVDPGKFYRSGQMTCDGFTEAVARYHFRTIVNLQDEFPDPEIPETYFSRRSVRESKLCRRLGVRYVYMPPDLIQRRLVPAERPETIGRFLALMDDPANYPVLIHCRAGLHRTGVLTAVYRMEYQAWPPQDAIRELKANGFGEFACTADNDYITQYILTYHPGLRTRTPTRSASEARQPRSASEAQPEAPARDTNPKRQRGCPSPEPAQVRSVSPNQQAKATGRP